MRKIVFTFFFSLILSYFCSSQSIDSLKILIKDIQRGSDDSVRLTANEKFLQAFEKMLLMPSSFTMNFDSLKNVSVQSSGDNRFRIYSWLVPHFNGDAYDYFGFIQLKTDTTYTLIRLQDSTSSIRKPESEKLTAERWLGAVYYNIIPITISGKVYYTLFGWKGKDQKQTQKILEVLYFNGLQPKFGYPLFKTGSVFRNRMIFTFNSQASMTLRFDKNFNGIVFDHISSGKNNPSLINGPDGTYDAFKLKKGKWILFNDVDIRTKWEPKETLPVEPEGK